MGSVNARYSSEPVATFYTHISDQYAPFHIKLISAAVRDATHVLDGLLYHAPRNPELDPAPHHPWPPA